VPDPYSLERLEDATEARREAVDRLMDPNNPTPHVVGVADGIKYRHGEPTGEQAISVFVSAKLPDAELRPEDRIPAEIQGRQTDVVEVGPLMPQPLTARMRPAWAGISIGHVNSTAGTLGSVVYDRPPLTTSTNPFVREGFFDKYYILSNNHVMAQSNAASIGDPILQPGPADGGTAPVDVIARLSRFVPIQFNPPTPLNTQSNYVDAALAEVDLSLADRRTYFGTSPRGFRSSNLVPIGSIVKKTGRTTGLSKGRVTNVNATVDVGSYPGNLTARFLGQLVLTGMSDFGDSGSLVTTLDDVAIGLLFAGNRTFGATLANSMEKVWLYLGAQVGDEIL